MKAGSITFSTALDNKQLETDLSRLTKKIEKTEQEIADIQLKRDKARDKSLFDAGVLDEEKAKLREIKKQLADIRAASKDKTLSLGTREELKAQIPSAQQEYADQKMRVNALRSEWNKLEDSIDRYDRKLERANELLGRQQDEAGELAQQIKKANSASAKMSDAASRAQAYMNKITERVKKMAANEFVFTLISKGLSSMKTWLGDIIKSNDEARASLARLKGALLTLVQPLVEKIVPAFIALVDVLTKIVAAVAKLVAMLFGKTIEQSAEAAENLYKEQEAISGVGTAAKEASKQLAAFDEINKLYGDTAGSAADSAGDAVSDIVPDFSFMDMDGLADELDGILDIVLKIGEAFLAWKISNALTTGLSGLSGLLGQTGLAGKPTSGLTSAMGSLLITVGLTLLFDDIRAILSGKYKNVSWESLIKTALEGLALGAGISAMAGMPLGWTIAVAILAVMAFKDIIVNWDKIKDMWGHIIDGIKALFTGDVDKFWDDISAAYLTWMNMDSWAAELIHWIADHLFGAGSWDKVKQFLEEGGSLKVISDYFGQKFQELGGTAVLQFQKGLLAAMAGIEGWLAGRLVNPIFNTILKLFGIYTPSVEKSGTELGAKIVSGIEDGVGSNLKGALDTVGAGLKSMVGIALNTVGMSDADQKSTVFESIGENAMAGLDSGLSTNVARPLNTIAGIGSNLVQLAEKATTDLENRLAESVSKPFDIDDTLSDAFIAFAQNTDKIEENLSGFISYLNSDLVPDHKDGWDNMYTATKENISKIIGEIDSLNAALASIERDIQISITTAYETTGSLSDGLSSPAASVPSISPRSVPSVASLTIPALAQGAVIPPNREFLAVLGDQKSGTNIEAPTSEIEAAVARGIQNAGVTGSGPIEVTVNFTGTAAQMVRMLHPQITAETKRRGTNFVEGMT